MTLFYTASMLKPLISSVDKTEIWSFKWMEGKPLGIALKAIAAAVLGRCWGHQHLPTEEARILLLPPPAAAVPDPAAGGVKRLRVLPANTQGCRTPRSPQPPAAPQGCPEPGPTEAHLGKKITYLPLRFYLVGKLQCWKVLEKYL